MAGSGPGEILRPGPSPLARTGRNLALKTTGEFLARLSFFFLFIYAARVLGADRYGLYSYGASLAALALTGMDLGLNTLLVRDGAQRREEVGAYAGTLLLLKAGLALSALGLIYAFCLSAGYPAPETGVIMLVALAQVCWGFSETGVAGLNALERMDREAVVKTLGRLAALLVAGGMLWLGWGVWGLVGGLLVANALAVGLSLGFLWRLARFRLRLERGFLRYLARESLPLALTNVFILVYFRVDMVMLQLMGRGYAEIGWYAAAVRVIDAVAVVPAMVSGAALPVLSGLARDDRQGFGRLYRQAQRLLVVLGLPAAVGLWAVREQVAVSIYGPRFVPTGQAFCWLAPALALLFLNFLQLGALTALGRQRLCAWSTGLCVVVNLGLNLWLIPAHGFRGAAAATLFTELALFAMCAWFLRAEAGLLRMVRQALRPAAAVGVMAVGLFFTRGLPLPIIVATAAALYGGALLLFRGVTREELVRLRTMWMHWGG